MTEEMRKRSLGNLLRLIQINLDIRYVERVNRMYWKQYFRMQNRLPMAESLQAKRTSP